MTNLDLGKMFGDSNQEMQKAAALKVYLVKLEDIFPSEENPYEVAEESVKSLADNIEEYGLFQALTAQKEGSENKLISGERRYSALKYLSDNGKKYSYNGEDITGYVPVSYIKPAIGDKKIMLMISANAHRDMQADEKNKIIDETLKTLEKRAMVGKFSWDGKRKATVISSITGIKEHYVKDYLAKKNKEIKFLESDSKSKQDAEEEKVYKNLLKQIGNCINKFKKLDSYSPASLTKDELDILQNRCLELELYLKEYMD